MLKSKIAMALAAAMVMAALYGCSSSSNNDGKVTQLEGQVGTLTDNAADVLAKLRMTAEGLGINVPAGVTAEAIADLIAGAGPDVVTTDPVEHEKAAKVVGPAVVAAAMQFGMDAADDDNQRARITADGRSVTDLGDDKVAEGSDGNADVKLKASEMMSADLSDDSFAGGVFAQDNGTDDEAATVVDTVYVYTNQARATDSEYNAFFDSAAENDSEARKGLSGITAGVADALNVLEIDETMVSDNMAFFESMSLPSANGSFMVYVDDADTDDVDERMFAGSFRGVPGTYACGGDAECRAERDADGDLTLDGEWTFTADEPEGDAMVMVEMVVPDADYVTFGFWLREMTNDGKPSAMVETIYGTKMVYNADTADDLEGDNAGEATYSGAATGKYVKKQFTVDGVGVVVAGGQFTADADLTAYFGISPSIAADKHNRVSGNITNFMSGGSLIDKDWSVALMGTVMDDDRAAAVNFANGGETPFVGTTVGDEGADAGAWEGLFAGPPTKPAPTEDDATVTAPIQPGGIVGEFNGHFTNGHVVGAFGATKDE